MKKYICSTFLRFRCFEIITSRLVASCTNLFLFSLTVLPCLVLLARLSVHGSIHRHLLTSRQITLSVQFLVAPALILTVFNLIMVRGEGELLVRS